MDNSNIKFSHRFHSFFQGTKVKWLWVSVFTGLVSCALIAAPSIWNLINGAAIPEETSLVKIQETIEKLKAEKSSQVIAQSAKVGVNATGHIKQLVVLGGYSESDVDYWRKQMDAFSLMTGVRLTITGRGASKFKNATRLTITIDASPKSGTPALAPVDLIKGLDFLQLYGYVETFNGTEAIVHVKEKTT